MAASTVYDLHWNSIPLGAIKCFEEWYDPYLGRGVYMLVLATTDSRYVGFYVGKSEDLGRRWREHVRDWFLAPHEGYGIAISAEDFLKNPVAVINNRAFEQGLSDRASIQSQILDMSWFVFSELHDLTTGHRLEDVEYVLQEGLKKHTEIQEDGYIGDASNRQRPTTELTIHNHFGRPFLCQTLPGEIVFDPVRGIR